MSADMYWSALMGGLLVLVVRGRLSAGGGQEGQEGRYLGRVEIQRDEGRAGARVAAQQRPPQVRAVLGPGHVQAGEHPRHAGGDVRRAEQVARVRSAEEHL